MNEETKTMTQETQNREEFIMLPTVDFCFKELMQNARVRQGMIAALLGVEPEEIEETICCRQSYIQNIRTINMEFWM